MLQPFTRSVLRLNFKRSGNGKDKSCDHRLLDDKSRSISCTCQEDRIRTGVYMGAIQNKPALSFGMKFLSKWIGSDRNLPTDAFTQSFFNLIVPLFRLLVSM